MSNAAAKNLKNFAGPNTFNSVGPQQVKPSHSLQNVFKSDSYQIQQPYIQITKEGYTIVSRDGSEKYSAERPRHIFQNLAARFLGVIALIFTMSSIIMFGVGLSHKIGSKPIASFVIFFSIVVGFAAAIMAFISISRLVAPLRKLSLFSEQNMNQALISIEPTTSLFIFNHDYVAKDFQGNVLFYCRKNFFNSFFMKKWHTYSPDNNYLFTAREDSLIKALLRNYVGLGKLIPLHFKFTKNEGQPFGEFIRRYSLRDKYSLNFKNASIEPWMLLATALLLDTGEDR